MVPNAEHIVDVMKGDFPEVEWDGLQPKNVNFAWETEISNENKNSKLGNIATHSFQEDDFDIAVGRYVRVTADLFNDWKTPTDEQIRNLKEKIDLTKPIYANFELRIWEKS